MSNNIIEKDKHGHPVVMVELRYAKKKQIEWYVRVHLENEDMDAGLKVTDYLNRLDVILKGEKRPRMIPVHADLVQTFEESKDFAVAPDDMKDWPCKGDFPEDGFDDDGNEYWMIVKFGGHNPAAPGACIGSDKSDRVNTRFSINGLEVILYNGQLACLHGRFLRHIRSLSAYQFARHNRRVIDTGHAIVETPNDPETGRAKIEEVDRFMITPEGCAGPVLQKQEDGSMKMCLPSRKQVISKGLQWNVDAFKNALKKMREVDAKHKREEDQLIMKKAAELYGNQMAQDELQRMAEVVKNRELAKAQEQAPEDQPDA